MYLGLEMVIVVMILLGLSDNSNIIIGGEAEISGNVYGGGNYASGRC